MQWREADRRRQRQTTEYGGLVPNPPSRPKGLSWEQTKFTIGKAGQAIFGTQICGSQAGGGGFVALRQGQRPADMQSHRGCHRANPGRPVRLQIGHPVQIPSFQSSPPPPPPTLRPPPSHSRGVVLLRPVPFLRPPPCLPLGRPLTSTPRALTDAAQAVAFVTNRGPLTV